MKTLIVLLLSLAPTLDYYFPVKDATFDAAVPTPSQALGFEIGERFAEWSDVVKYMEVLSQTSPRASIKFWGRTFEGRHFVQLFLTDPSMQDNLEEIRTRHLSLSGPCPADVSTQPVVINLMGAVHGNEPSGLNALLAVAYWYAASLDNSTVETLKNSVIVITPGQNPDGANRFATWVNSNASNTHWLDTNAREYVENLPKSRPNHYWMDCNRDWLTAQFPEGKTSVRMYRWWMPNVVLDLHEQGSKEDGIYYFSPGDPNRTYSYIPERNQELTRRISEYTSSAMDAIGTSHFSGHGYDDFFIGKGAAFGDIQGSVGILHEEARTDGHYKNLKYTGPYTFAQTVRNQSYGAFAVVNAATDMRIELLEYQKDFYANARKDAAEDPTAGYVFDAGGNRGIAFNFLENLRLHDLDVYEIEGLKGSYAVPLAQKHYYMVKCLFEDITEYADSVFYDISTWSVARAFGLNFRAVDKMPALGRKIDVPTLEKGLVHTVDSKKLQAVAYAFEPSEYYTPRMISSLQQQGIAVKVSVSSFVCGGRSFPAGTLVLPLEARNALDSLASCCGVDVYPLVEASGRKRGFRLSQLELKEVIVPHTAVVYSSLVAATGAVWYLLDRRYEMPHSIVDFTRLSSKSCSLDGYTSIVLMGKVPSRDEAPAAYEKLEAWVRAGGTLIMQAAAHSAADFMGAPPIEVDTGEGVSGIVLNASRNSDTPLLWGYGDEPLAVFKNKATVWTAPEGADAVMSWTADPYLSGCVSEKNLSRIALTPMLLTARLGEGTLVYMQEDFCYRSYWYSTSHIMTNSIFFGNLVYR